VRSWTEDNINIYQSPNGIVRRGLIDGNNSPSGDGIMVESGAAAEHEHADCLVKDVDLVNQGNGPFGAWGVANVTCADCRILTTHCEGFDGRGPPSSGALAFAGGNEGDIFSSNIRISGAVMNGLCNPSNLFWPSEAFSEMDATSDESFPEAKYQPLNLEFCWEQARTNVLFSVQ